MAIPKVPWFDKVQKIVAPTEPATNVILIVIIVITVVVLLWGKPIIKAAWATWLILP